ncbi:acyl carrier protein [Nonomuraea insulae]|uniref:Acyl carrier protein n=1 Tax=Nonomuraea insulae TaxID=1616787 RepID=A0ABW1D6B5_9ACTN
MNEVTEIVATEMGDILACRPLLPDEDFFLCGGDSLRAVELISRLVARYEPGSTEKSVLGPALLLVIFDEATPESIAGLIVNQLGRRAR